MTSCDRDTPVPDWIIEHPETLPVIQTFGIDYSCGGKSLAYACREQRLDVAIVLKELHRCLRNEDENAFTEEMTNGNSSCEPR